jgi:hypothetical protein
LFDLIFCIIGALRIPEMQAKELESKLRVSTKTLEEANL